MMIFPPGTETGLGAAVGTGPQAFNISDRVNAMNRYNLPFILLHPVSKY